MGNNWPRHRLDELTEAIVDCPHSTPKWTDHGVVVLRNQNIRDGRLDLSDPSFTTNEGYEERIRRAKPSAGDLVLTREAPMGEVCQIPVGLTCCLGQRMVLIRANPKILDPSFLLYVMQGREIKHQISWNEGTGTTVSNIRIPNIKSFQIPTPELGIQKTIAHILGTLDDKIELNRKMNATLESMAQAMFKSWFVDFDPVIDNALAAGNPIPEPLQQKAQARKELGDQKKSLPPDIQKLFPDQFQFNEILGWIPVGWKPVCVSELCKVVQNGGTPRRGTDEYWNDGHIPWLTSGEVRQPILTSVENFITQSGLDNSSAKWLPAGSTVVAMYGATAGQVAFAAVPLTTNQAVCGLVPNNSYTYFNYLFLSRNEDALLNQARGSAQQNINKGIVERTKTARPIENIAIEFDRTIKPLFSKIVSAIDESKSLAKLRDTLLPKLLSGELRIPDAEKLVGEAT